MVGTWGHLTTKYRFPRICCEQQACSASRSLACRYICITSMLKLSRVTRQQRKHFFFCYDSGITREAGDLLTLTSSAQRGNWKWTARWSLPKICHLRVIVPECCFFLFVAMAETMLQGSESQLHVYVLFTWAQLITLFPRLLLAFASLQYSFPM